MAVIGGLPDGIAYALIFMVGALILFNIAKLIKMVMGVFKPAPYVADAHTSVSRILSD